LHFFKDTFFLNEYVLILLKLKKKDMKKNYNLIKGLFSSAIVLFSSSGFSQGDCGDLVGTPIEIAMGLDTQPTGFFVRSGFQLGRIFRDGTATTCPSEAYPGDFNQTTAYNYTAVRFYATAAMCVTVNVNVDNGTTPCTTNGHGHIYQSVDGLSTSPYDASAQATNYLGDLGTSATGAISVDVVAGWFEVVFTNTSAQNNCNLQFTFADNGGVIKCDEPLNIQQNSDLSGVEMFPNPANGVVNFKSGKNAEITFVEIFDIYGKLVLAKDFTSSSDYSMNIQDLKSGIYSVKISSPASFVTKKLAVK
jgi:hypothetical protein